MMPSIGGWGSRLGNFPSKPSGKLEIVHYSCKWVSHQKSWFRSEFQRVRSSRIFSVRWKTWLFLIPIFSNLNCGVIENFQGQRLSQVRLDKSQESFEIDPNRRSNWWPFSKILWSPLLVLPRVEVCRHTKLCIDRDSSEKFSFSTCQDCFIELFPEIQISSKGTEWPLA